jgi:hypothetical protein
MTRGKNTLATQVNSSKLQGDLDFVFDQRESEVKLHKTTSSTESPLNVSPGAVGDQIIGNQIRYGTIDQYRYPFAETMNCSKNKNI